MNKLTNIALQHDAQWAIYAPAGRLLWQQLRGMDLSVHVASVEAGQPEPFAWKDADAKGPAYDGDQTRDGVALISMVGPMSKAPTSMSGGVSTVRVRREIRAAVSDPDIKAILLRIDSPGGSVSGTADLAADLAAASAQKPVYAYCEDYCCSAAYWAAASCTKILAGSTAIVGSIGTYMVLYDQSKLIEGLGIEALLFTTGPQKGAGAEGIPVTDEQKAAFQATVDSLNTHFLAAIAKGRRMSQKATKALATGDVWIGADAAANGLIDGVCSLDEAIAELSARKARQSTGAKNESANDVLTAALAEGRAYITRAEAIKMLGLPQFDNDLPTSEAAPIATTLEGALESALIAVTGAADLVTGVLSRIADVKAIRESQGRVFSPARLDQLRELSKATADMLTTCESLNSDTAPQGDTTRAAKARLALQLAIPGA